MPDQPGSHASEHALARWFADLNHQGIVATDDQLRVITWNRWMEVHSGVPRDRARGRHLYELFPDLCERGLDEYYERARAGEVSVISHGLHRYVLPLKPTNADVSLPYMPQSARIGPLWEDGSVVGTVTLVDDVSDRLASETELRRQIEAQKLAREAAERALRAKDEFLSTLSHELRQPLNAVLGWTRMLRDRTNADPALQTRALEIIDRNATVQARMIDDLLDMARIVTGKLRLDLQRLDLAPVALAAIDVVTPTARAKGVTITTHIRDDVPPVLGDPARLQQVVWNLLSNAVKFTDPGGSIELRLEARGAGVELQVADTGSGIRPEFLPFLFHRFSQGDASSTRREGGLGLGLALVRELVELHGGTVDAASDGEGTGATFTVHLPAMITPDPLLGPGTEGRESTAGAALAGTRVLVVDDDADVRDLAVAALSSAGAEVVVATSSSEAVAIVANASAASRPRVILSDIAMPQEDGYVLIRQLRALPPDRGGRIPAVALAHAHSDDRERAIAAGYQVHTVQPTDPRAIVAAVLQALTVRA